MMWVMDMVELAKRKHPRLNNYDYSMAGAYFITICTYNRRCLLSRIVGRGLAPAVLELSEYGKMAEEQLLLIEKRYPSVKICEHVIMPNHIHFIMVISGETAGASPRPTVMDVVCAYKSLTTRRCKKIKPIKKLFQTSFYEHILRGREDYEETVNYIYENPLRWFYDKLYTEE